MKESRINENVILKLAIEFSLMAIEYCELLEKKKKFVVSNQLLKSATSIGANLFEAQNAESKPDFVHKVKLAAKEVDETKYWLILCSQSSSYPEASTLIDKLNNIERVINKILSTSKSNNQRPN
ncbi:MAG: four helix bundle protein [Bacteroidia bacterium]